MLEKIKNLQWHFQLILLVGIGGLLYVGVWYFVTSVTREEVRVQNEEISKLDEQDATPELLLAPRRTRLPITWVTTGQAVPEDLEQPTATRLGELASRGVAPTNHTKPRAA